MKGECLAARYHLCNKSIIARYRDILSHSVNLGTTWVQVKLSWLLMCELYSATERGLALNVHAGEYENSSHHLVNIYIFGEAS